MSRLCVAFLSSQYYFYSFNRTRAFEHNLLVQWPSCSYVIINIIKCIVTNIATFSIWKCIFIGQWYFFRELGGCWTNFLESEKLLQLTNWLLFIVATAYTKWGKGLNFLYSFSECTKLHSCEKILEYFLIILSKLIIFDAFGNFLHLRALEFITRSASSVIWESLQ